MLCFVLCVQIKTGWKSHKKSGHQTNGGLTLSVRGSTLDVRFWRLKSVPALKELNISNGRRPVTSVFKCRRKSWLIHIIRMIPNWKNPLVSIVYTNIFQRFKGYCLFIIYHAGPTSGQRYCNATAKWTRWSRSTDISIQHRRNIGPAFMTLAKHWDNVEVVWLYGSAIIVCPVIFSRYCSTLWLPSKHSTDVVLILGPRRRRWPNIKTTLVECTVLAGWRPGCRGNLADWYLDTSVAWSIGTCSTPGIVRSTR